MSNDIATLGIRVDSSSAATAATTLDKLAASAKPAAAATTNLEKAHAGMSTQAMAAQHSIRSMIEGMAQGIPVTQMLGMQLNHLSYAATGPGGITGAFKQAGGALLGLLNPTTAVVGGLVAIAAAGIFAINNIAKTEKALDDLAHSAGTTVASLHGLESAAAFKGIDSAEFTKGMEHFGALVYEAQHNMGSLAETFRANGASAKTFDDYLEKAADLIKNASSDAQRLQMLQQMGLPATMEWVRLMQAGGQGLRDAVAAATKFGEAADAQLIAKAREFDDAWAKGIKNLSTSLRNAAIEGAGWLDSLSAKGTALLMKLPGIGGSVPTNILRNAMNDRAEGIDIGSRLNGGSDVSGFYRGTGAGNASAAAGPKVKTPAERQKEISDQQTYIGLLGQTASAEQAAQQVQLAADATYLSTGVRVSQTKIDQLKQLAREQSLGITAIKASTDAQRVEADTVGMSVGQAAAYAAAQNAINEARRAGRTLTPENIAAIQAEASALGQAAARADDMKFAYSSLVNGPMQAFRSALAQGSNWFDALKKAGISALDALSSRLMDMASRGLWNAAFPAGSGGGILSLLGLGGSGGGGGGAVDANGIATQNHTGYGPGDPPGPTRYVHPAHFNDAPRFHSGIGPGERAAVIRNDESVLTPGQMKALSPAGGGGVTIHQYNTFTGNDPGTEARVRQQIAQSKDMAVQEAVAAVAKTIGTTPSYGNSKR